MLRRRRGAEGVDGAAGQHATTTRDETQKWNEEIGQERDENVMTGSGSEEEQGGRAVATKVEEASDENGHKSGCVDAM